MSLSIQTCFGCGSTAHLKRNCNVNRGRVCNYCKKSGHFVADCDKLKKKGEKKQAAAAAEKSQVNSWANIVKKTGDVSVIAQVEADNKRVEDEKHRKKEEQRQFAIARHQKYLAQLETRHQAKEKANAEHIETLKRIRGPYWFMYTEESADEFSEESMYDIREIAEQLRYNHELASEMEEIKEELREKQEYEKYKSDKIAERGHYKATLSEEEFAEWEYNETNRLFDEIDEDHYRSETMYLSSVPTEYSRNYCMSGIMLNPEFRPIENERRNREIGKRR
jgi:hypothetical protein